MLVEMRMGLRTRARPAWAMWMDRTVGCVLFEQMYDSYCEACNDGTAVRFVRKRHTVQPAVHRSMSRLRRPPSGCGSWCTTDHQGGALRRRRTALVSDPPMGKVFNKTTTRQHRGSEKRPSRGMQMRSPSLVACTSKAKV